MTAQQYLALSTKLVGDVQPWVLESAEHNALSPTDIEALNAARKIVDRVTLREAGTKADAEPEGGTIIV